MSKQPTSEYFLPQRKPHADPLGAMRQRMQRTGQWHEGQMAGRRWPMACVSLEITQRCNLDCTLCYLSETSEAVLDFPMEEIFRRIDMIIQHFGPGTDVQVSGGEPTLRKRDELIAVVQRLSQMGLRPSLLTNGIKATRELLSDLADAGLVDVAFHVDTTQERQGYQSEADLNALRRAYIERARGLPISVFFNTTVHAGNFHEVSMLAAFFVANADMVRFASFQLQADTGRGVLRAREDTISNESVSARMQQGAGVAFRLNVLGAGHADCNRSAVLLVVNGRAYDAFDDTGFVQRFMRESAHLRIDRGTKWRSFQSLLQAVVTRPRLAVASLRWGLGLAWRMRADLWAGRCRVNKLAFFTHNFMDAKQLDNERVEACVFMAVTQDGPMSMCVYNAQRDHFLLQPLQTAQGLWQPLRPTVREVAIKWLKGRPRADALRQRGHADASGAIEIAETTQ